MTTNRNPSVFLKPNSDDDGNHIQNKILLGLPLEERDLVIPRLELTRSAAYTVLHESGDTLKSAHFCNSGLVSILSVFPDGKSVEVGLIGNEGFVGLPLIAGFRSANTRAEVQIEGTAFRLDARTLVKVLPDCPHLEKRLQQFSQIMGMQVAQISACNRVHDMDARLVRWLLMSADRIESSTVPLTHEFLAQMLGTRRSSVTVSAGNLQRAGLIALGRGEVEIINRKGLEKASCACYGIMLRQTNEWQSESRPKNGN